MAAPRASAPSRSSRWRRVEWLLPAALGALFLWTGVGATSFRHGPLALTVVGLLYGLLALFLHVAARFALRATPTLGAIACLALALVVAAQQRMDAERLVRWPVCALSVVGLGAVYFGWLRVFSPRGARATFAELGLAAVLLAALAAGTVLAARASPELAWHFLRNHRLLGTPLYQLTSRRIDAERDALWRGRRLTEPWEQADGAPPAPVPIGRAPHVVFLMLDTLRADALAALGGADDVMPRMNARAAKARVFTDVHANASWTRASCASIFTGLLPEEHGAARFHERLASEWHTLPERLQEAGYQTAAFIANWVQVGRETGFAQGFEESDFHELAGAEEILERAGADAPERALRGAYARAAAVNSAVLAWLDGSSRDPYRPLFLYLHYLDPHTPYLEPPEPGTLSDARERRRGLYRQQLRYLDRKLDELLHDLEERLGPLVVVFTSDHGEEFWEHDDLGHGHTLYRELVWVPLFVQQPGGAPGTCDAPLESRDLYALLLDLAADPGLDLDAWGRAHARATRYASQYLDRDVDARDERRATGLRRVDAGDATLIWSAFGPTLELYEHAQDPDELDNAIGRDPDRARALRAALDSSVRFWTAPSRVERSARDLAFLRALGYAGGLDAP